ncbi:MAG: helix-turn-helix domain-containing protein [Chloroflexi bacterium]|nr:helix-turn-helix domain-containing protein [Chloroflexota bacterium]
MLQLRVAQSTVERLIREGKLPALTLSEGVRVRRRDLEAWEDAQRRP